MSGAPGHTGPTGATGRRGLQGTPYGAPGTTFYSTAGRITTQSGTSGGGVNIQPTTSAYGVTWLMGSGDPIITLPSTISASDYGAFWRFRNNQTSKKTMTFNNTAGILYNGDPAATSFDIQPGTTVTLVFSGGSDSSATYIAL